jgi:hypothetical protein
MQVIARRGSKPRMVRVQAHLRPDQWRAILRLAEERDCPHAQVLREIVERWRLRQDGPERRGEAR